MSQTLSKGGAAAPVAPEAEAPMQAASPAMQRNDGKTAEQVKITLEQRSIVYVAEMTVRAKDVSTASDQAKQLVAGAGGHLASEESNSYDSGDGSATLVFKIPPARYQEVLNKLAKDLGKRETLQQNTTDVTEQVADVESRLKSSEQALASLRTLLKRADTIGQVLQVEREISAREAELESLQARQKSLTSQVAMGTLTLRLVGPAALVVEPEDEPAGFLGGLKSGWDGLVSFVKVVLTVVGVLLPWLIVIVPLTFLALALVRRRRANRPGPAPYFAAGPDLPPHHPGEASSRPADDDEPSGATRAQ